MYNKSKRLLLSIFYFFVQYFAIYQMTYAADYAVGADLSFLKQTEDRGTVFKDDGQAKPGLEIFRDHGYNWIRLRLFHTPTQLPNNLEYTIALAKEAKKLGFKILLNYHYSDTWADPAKQFIPKAWKDKTHAELVTAVEEYTKDTIAAFREADVMPDMVQVGNEIVNGMMWPDGKVPDNWNNFADLVKAGIRGVKAGANGDIKGGDKGGVKGDSPIFADAKIGTVPGAKIGTVPRIMIHIDQGGNKDRTKYFFDKLNSYDVDYDVIGQSYYPWWHGSMLDLRENMIFMAEEYKKDIILVEVAYCWRPTEYITKPKGDSPIFAGAKIGTVPSAETGTVPKLAPFPETPEGQKEFLGELNRIVLDTPHNRGIGIFWWEPAVTGRLRSRGFFDNDGNALPVITVFDKFTRGKTQK
jgi:arabinogalactan endo-1,4-beta-galactosidase